MARGWESKSIEEQQSEASTSSKPVAPPMSAAEVVRKQHRDGFMLARQRVLQQLQVACNSNHRKMLEQALADIERQISQLE